MEIQMFNFGEMEVQIQRARLARHAAIGELIADAVLAIWSVLKRAGQFVATKAAMLATTPDSYSTSVRQQ
jgi:hypothetical protein